MGTAMGIEPSCSRDDQGTIITDEEIIRVWRTITKVEHLVLASDTISAIHACIKLERKRCATKILGMRFHASVIDPSIERWNSAIEKAARLLKAHDVP